MESRGNQGASGFVVECECTEELEGAKRNKTAFLRIAKEMNEVGYERTWQQCRVKAKNIGSNYIKITAQVAKCKLNELSYSSSSTLFTVFTTNYCI